MHPPFVFGSTERRRSQNEQFPLTQRDAAAIKQTARNHALQHAPVAARTAVIGQALQARLAGGNHGHFRHGEKAIQQDEKQESCNIHCSAAHLPKARGFPALHPLAESLVRLGLPGRGLCAVDARLGSRGRVIRDAGTAVIHAGLFGKLAQAFFFLLFLFRQVSLAFFELVVWFGQDITFDYGRADRSGVEIERARSPPLRPMPTTTRRAARRRTGRARNRLQLNSDCRRGRRHHHHGHRHRRHRSCRRHRRRDSPADGLRSRSGCGRRCSCR